MSLPKWCKENDIRESAMKYYVYQVHKKKSDETVSFVPTTVIDINTYSRLSSISSVFERINKNKCQIMFI